MQKEIWECIIFLKNFPLLEQTKIVVMWSYIVVLRLKHCFAISITL